MSTMAEQDKVLAKIQALIDKAHSTEFDEEAKSLLAKADSLMVKYSIEQFEILDPARRTTARGVVMEEPEIRTIHIQDRTPDIDSKFADAVRTLFYYSAEHLFVRTANLSMTDAKVVGYPVDLRFLEMFFLKLKLQMFSEMIVTVDPEGDWIAQIAGLKNMGYKWEEIHRKMQAHPQYPGLGERWSKAVGSKFYSKVVRYYEDNGIARNKSSNPKAWREDFVDGYVYRIWERLKEMRAATVGDNPLLPDLIGQKKSSLDELFFSVRPDLRPHPEHCDCDTCHAKKCTNRSTCKRTVCANARKPIRYGSYRYRNTHSDALSAGRTAANRADLTDKGPIG